LEKLETPYLCRVEDRWLLLLDGFVGVEETSTGIIVPGVILVASERYYVGKEERVVLRVRWTVVERVAVWA
jgi:hypothetical protein